MKQRACGLAVAYGRDNPTRQRRAAPEVWLQPACRGSLRTRGCSTHLECNTKCQYAQLCNHNHNKTTHPPAVRQPRCRRSGSGLTPPRPCRPPPGHVPARGTHGRGVGEPSVCQKRNGHSSTLRTVTARLSSHLCLSVNGAISRAGRSIPLSGRATRQPCNRRVCTAWHVWFPARTFLGWPL